MIIYEVPLILILFIVLGSLGIIGESSSALPMITAIIVAITEVIFLFKVIYNNYNDINRSESKSRWFFIYLMTIAKSAILCATTYFFFEVPADMIANSRGLNGIFSFIGAIVYICLSGTIYASCILGIWAMGLAGWDVKKGEEQSATFFWTVIMLLSSIALFFISKFALPAMFL